MAVRVCSVSSPHSSCDLQVKRHCHTSPGSDGLATCANGSSATVHGHVYLPEAIAMKTISWSCIHSSTQPPVARASNNDSAAMRPMSSALTPFSTKPATPPQRHSVPKRTWLTGGKDTHTVTRHSGVQISPEAPNMQPVSVRATRTTLPPVPSPGGRQALDSVMPRKDASPCR
jgi:hypothetical protein